jgi:hypothetical protein
MGNVTPDLWMRNATGAPVGAEALLAATAASLSRAERGISGTTAPRLPN